METFFGLYRILVAVSAATLLLGLILLAGQLRHLGAAKKHLYIMAVVNLISMMAFLFHIRSGYQGTWNEVVLFLEITILVLNLILGYYAFKALHANEKSFGNQIQSLFLVSFISICTYVIIYYIMESKGGIYNKQNPSFPWIYSMSILLMAFGSIYPALISSFRLFKVEKEIKMIYILLVLNGLNNLVGLVFFLGEFPTKQIGVIANIICNLLFAYYMAYYFLSEFFELRRNADTLDKKTELKSTNFSWEELSKHLNYWSEFQDYLTKFYPELIQDINNLPLTENEKIHLALKKLNIKAKDIANAMNVSVKAIEMNRYRIKQKLSK